MSSQVFSVPPYRIYWISLVAPLGAAVGAYLLAAIAWREQHPAEAGILQALLVGLIAFCGFCLFRAWQWRRRSIRVSAAGLAPEPPDPRTPLIPWNEIASTRERGWQLDLLDRHGRRLIAIDSHLAEFDALARRVAEETGPLPYPSLPALFARPFVSYLPWILALPLGIVLSTARPLGGLLLLAAVLLTLLTDLSLRPIRMRVEPHRLTLDFLFWGRRSYAPHEVKEFWIAADAEGPRIKPVLYLLAANGDYPLKFAGTEGVELKRFLDSWQQMTLPQATQRPQQG